VDESGGGPAGDGGVLFRPPATGMFMIVIFFKVVKSYDVQEQT
jgi:hypothetical protein